MRKETKSNGDTFYYDDLGQLHREDGPAVEFANGTKYWFFRNKHIDCKTNEEFLQLMKMKAFW